MSEPTTERACICPPCPGRGIDGHGMTHCAECCWGTGVEADITCPEHGDPYYCAPPNDRLLAALERAARETGWTADELTDALAILTPIIATELAAAREALGRVRELVTKWDGCWCPPQMYDGQDPRVRDCPSHGDMSAEHFGGIIRRDLTAALDGPSDGGGV